MSKKIKDVNHPSSWNMRIWDADNNEWLCEHDKDALAYYGFDIRGGEVATVQGMQFVYALAFHGRNLIWERSTGLTDKNGKEIYEGDIVKIMGYGVYKVFWREWDSSFSLGAIDTNIEEYKVLMLCRDWEDDYEVIGNVHEDPELLEKEEE